MAQGESTEARVPETASTIKVTVRRGRPDEHFDEEFGVPSRENQTILDVVSWTQQNIDPTLSYRFSCRVGMCGSCAMTVNGMPRWTCRTHVRKVLRNDRLEIAPLRNLPVIKDLAVDMDPFFQKWIEADGFYHPTRARNDPIEPVTPKTPGRAVADAGIECINCSACYSACDTVAGSREFLGPAALQRAWTLLNDVMDSARPSILEAVSRTNGCHNCHSMGNCTASCPKGLDPVAALAGLKRETTLSWFARRG